MARPPKVPITIVMQMKVRRPLNGIQLFTTAAMEIKISRKYMTVCRCSTVNGAMILVTATIAVTVRANGSALDNAVFKNLPRILRVSDSQMVRNDGYPSIAASSTVI